MGCVIPNFGRPVSTTYIADDLHEPRGSRLAAVVIWRRGSAEAGGPPAPHAPWTLPAGWSGAIDADGRREVLYHDERRVVRLLGTDYPLAPDPATALLFLIDEGRHPATPPAITVRTLGSSVHSKPPIDSTLDEQARLLQTAIEAWDEQEAWDRAARNDPAVQEFVSIGSGEDGT